MMISFIFCWRFIHQTRVRYRIWVASAVAITRAIDYFLFISRAHGRFEHYECAYWHTFTKKGTNELSSKTNTKVGTTSIDRKINTDTIRFTVHEIFCWKNCSQVSDEHGHDSTIHKYTYNCGILRFMGNIVIRLKLLVQSNGVTWTHMTNIFIGSMVEDTNNIIDNKMFIFLFSQLLSQYMHTYFETHFSKICC